MNPTAEPLPASIRSLEERADRELAMLDHLKPTALAAAAQHGGSVTADPGTAPELDAPGCIDVALQKLDSDPGALFTREVLDALTEVRQADPARYQRVRAAVKGKASVVELDKLTTPRDGAGTVELFPEVEPWPHPVDGAAMLAAMYRIIAQHVVADPPTICAATLWVAHTYCMEALTVSPLAHISAPEMRCGKTVLLTAMMRLCHRPLSVASISPAAIFRTVEQWAPTLGIDEVDAFLKDNEEARGLINSGLYRETAVVIRCTGDDNTPTKFSTWAPKILCGIGKLAGTIEDRSIPLRMRRKVAGEVAASIRRSDPQPWTDLQAQLTRWADDRRHAVGMAHPTPAVGLGDRAQDCWEPLLAIADEVGGEWPRRARAAALALHGMEEDRPSIGVELLRDVEAAFNQRGTSRLASRELLEILTGDDEAPWATWNRGKPLTVRQLAARLSEFGVASKTTRLPNGDRLKGYALADFADAFPRYLSAGEGVSKRDTVTMASDSHLSRIAKRDAASCVTDENTQKTASDSHCHGVTDKTGGVGKKEEGDAGTEAFDL